MTVIEAAATEPTVFVFPGHGSQCTSPAVDLLDSPSAFADEMRLCEEVFADLLGWSLLDAVRGDDDSPTLDRVEISHPVFFALTVSLAAQWRAMGVEPDAVLGHSHGEIAAAYVAGALSLSDAARVVAVRRDAIRAITGTGGMVAIALSVGRVHDLIEPWSRLISVAAQDSPSSTVVSGCAAALDELMIVCERNNVPARRLPINYASHSGRVDELRDALRHGLSELRPRSGDITFISAVTGAGLDTSILDSDYWFANMRQPVLFEQAVRWSCEHGYRRFVEVIPLPVLGAGIQEVLQEYRTGATHVERLNPGGRR
jgi:acyl transferase domain-containing protein